MDQSSATTIEHVAAWLQQHEHAFSEVSSAVKTSTAPAKLTATFESPHYLVDISAWNHADCLDIIALNKQTKTEEYLISGSCNGAKAVTERLESFLQWFTSHEKAPFA